MLNSTFNTPQGISPSDNLVCLYLTLVVSYIL